MYSKNRIAFFIFSSIQSVGSQLLPRRSHALLLPYSALVAFPFPFLLVADLSRRLQHFSIATNNSPSTTDAKITKTLTSLSRALSPLVCNSLMNETEVDTRSSLKMQKKMNKMKCGAWNQLKAAEWRISD